jgi:hypothetical protein
MCRSVSQICKRNKLREISQVFDADHQEIEYFAETVSSHEGLFFIVGQGANTLRGPGVGICDSMSKVSLKSAALKKSF